MRTEAYKLFGDQRKDGERKERQVLPSPNGKSWTRRATGAGDAMDLNKSSQTYFLFSFALHAALCKERTIHTYI